MRLYSAAIGALIGFVIMQDVITLGFFLGVTFSAIYNHLSGETK